MILAVLGPMVFAPDLGSIDELTREAHFDWAALMPVDGEPVRQFVGLGDKVFSVQGAAHLEHSPEAGIQLTTLERLAGTGTPLPFVLGNRVFGLWCIERVSRTGTLFDRTASPGILDFQVEMKHYNTIWGLS